MTLETFRAKVNSASIITIDDSPYLHSITIEDDVKDPDEIVARANWDSEGYDFDVAFSLGSILEANVDAQGTLHLKDVSGELTEIRLFNLERISF